MLTWVRLRWEKLREWCAPTPRAGYRVEGVPTAEEYADRMAQEVAALCEDKRLLHEQLAAARAELAGKPVAIPRLTPAQIERLALLAEECGEVMQAVSKILRHGYESRNPFRHQSF